MANQDKKLFSSLLQVALVASLLRQQSDDSLSPAQPAAAAETAFDADLVLGETWAHTLSGRRGAGRPGGAGTPWDGTPHRKGLDRMIERLQEDVFHDLSALGRYGRFRHGGVDGTGDVIHAYRLFSDPLQDRLAEGDAAEGAGNSSAARAGEDEERDEVDTLGGLEQVAVIAQYDPPVQIAGSFNSVWDMIDADLASASPPEIADAADAASTASCSILPRPQESPVHDVVLTDAMAQNEDGDLLDVSEQSASVGSLCQSKGRPLPSTAQGGTDPTPNGPTDEERDLWDATSWSWNASSSAEGSDQPADGVEDDDMRLLSELYPDAEHDDPEGSPTDVEPARSPEPSDGTDVDDVESVSTSSGLSVDHLQTAEPDMELLLVGSTEDPELMLIESPEDPEPVLVGSPEDPELVLVGSPEDQELMLAGSSVDPDAVLAELANEQAMLSQAADAADDLATELAYFKSMKADDRRTSTDAEDSGQGSSTESNSIAGDSQLQLLDDMLHVLQRRRLQDGSDPFQGRFALARTMSMEQRWQDLASMLSLPPASQQDVPAVPHHHHLHHYHHYHPHATYTPHYASDPYTEPQSRSSAVLLHNVSLAPPPQQLTTPPQQLAALVVHHHHGNASGVYAANMAVGGAAGVLPVTPVDSSAPGGELTYYQSEPVPSVAPQPAAGSFLSQILGVDELPLLEVPPIVAENHSDWSGEHQAVGEHQFSPVADYAKSDGVQRNFDYTAYRPVPHPDTGIPHPDTGVPHPDTGVPAPAPSDLPAHQSSSIPQKKHQMYGKRCYFQPQEGQFPVAGPSSGSSCSGRQLLSPSPMAYSYGAEAAATSYLPPSSTAVDFDAPEIKYSCGVDFLRQEQQQQLDSMNATSHNHTYHQLPVPQLPENSCSGADNQLSTARHKHREVAGGGAVGRREHLSRDERRAHSMRIPLTNDEIVSLPMDEFNELLTRHSLTESQLSLIRDIRRRGKNKLAAQNCRKRKMDQIVSLAEQVDRARLSRRSTYDEHQRLIQQRTLVQQKYSRLYRHVFQTLRDPDGNPYSPLQYTLQPAHDGGVLLVPHNATSGAAVDTGPQHELPGTQPPADPAPPGPSHRP